MKQAKAASYIRELLRERNFDITARRMTLAGNQRWPVFERNGRQVGVDTAGGIWLRESAEQEWRLLAKTHTSSGAIMAADFLSQD